jgi:Domain of unknown function (DUF4407)
MRKFQQLRRFVLALSGTHEDVLELVPSERARFESLGWAILITSCMAVVSMWFALSSALGVNGILAVPVALGWGLVIMGIDRWLITSMPVDGGRKFAMAVPRLLLALLLGTLISTPLVLRVFQSEISAQMAVMQQKNYDSFLAQQSSSQVNKQVTAYQKELQQLNTVINSRGAQTGDSAADPQLVAYKQQLTQLQSQLTHWTSLKNTYYTNYTCQLYGGANCPKKGDGPAAKASLASYQQASGQVSSYQAQVGQVQGEIRQRDAVLKSSSAASQQQRYQEALSQRPVVTGEYNTALQRKNQLQASYYAQEQASHCILMRLEALSQLSTGNSTVADARVLLFLLFLVIECLPVTVKLLQRPGQYEAALREAKKAEERDFKKAFATRSRFAFTGLPSPGGPGAGNQSPAQPPAPESTPGPGLRPEPGPEPIWNRTRVLPRPGDGRDGDAEDARPTEVFTGSRPRQGHRAGGGAPDDRPRRERRWRGVDEFRNFWAQREDAGPPPATGREQQADGPSSEPTRLDLAAVPGRPDPWTAATLLDAPAPPTRTDYPASSGADDGYQDAGWSDDNTAPPPPGTARPGHDQAQPDGNGAGIPLNWDDE